ncbi:MAG TPA: GDP-mannose 4,6-dehydratase, partial [Flexilinea sp.]|nr:GDP-mannose 4,6-dehydratase [Flexilinea sp.]
MPQIKGKNVLITGGAGFIGSHLTDALLKNQAGKVVIVDNFFLGKMENLDFAQKNYNNLVIYRDDARDLGTMKAIIKKESVEVVFNLATIALNYSFFNPFGAYRVNVDIAEVLLHLLQDGAYQTLIHSSSSEAYGTAVYSPMDENHPMNPTTPYAAGKASADLMIQSFYNVLHLDVAIIRPFNNFGPRQNDLALAAIIPQNARRILNGEKPVLEGTGEQTRDFIYVEDTARAFIMAYESEMTRGRVINLGSGKEISMKAVIDAICKYYG